MYVTPLPTPPDAGLEGMPKPTAARTEASPIGSLASPAWQAMVSPQTANSI